MEPCTVCLSGSELFIALIVQKVPEAGVQGPLCDFYGDTYTFVLSTLTLTPGPLQIFCNWKNWAGLGTKLTYVQQPVANK